MQIYDIGGTVNKLYRHPYTVSTAVLRIQSNINGMHRSMKDVALAENTEEREYAVNEVNRMERQVLRDFEIIEERFLGDLILVIDARDSFENWAVIRAKVIEFSRNNQMREAAYITKHEGADYITLMNNKIQLMADYASEKAVSFINEAELHARQGWIAIFSLLLISCITSAVIAFLITNSIRNPLNSIMNGIKQIERGQLDFKT